jgi:hypothetical protein
VVTASNPAITGETIAVYLTGLGSVDPAVADGAGASSTLSITDDPIDVFVDGQHAIVPFSGLAPGFAGLYQVNFVVPFSPDTGPLHLDIGDEANGAYNSMVLLYVPGKSSAASTARSGLPAGRVLRKRPSPAIHGIRASASVHKRGRQFIHEFY